MPSGRMIAWIVAISLVTTIALEQYRAKSAAGAKLPGLRRAA